MGIYFNHICEVRTRKNTYINTLSESTQTPTGTFFNPDWCTLLSSGELPFHSDGLDVLLRGGGGTNFALDIPSRVAVLGPNPPATTAAHEIGHCLGMLHTDQGWWMNRSLYPDTGCDGENCYDPELPFETQCSSSSLVSPTCAEYQGPPDNMTIVQIVTGVIAGSCNPIFETVFTGNGKSCGDLIASTPPDCRLTWAGNNASNCIGFDDIRMGIDCGKPYGSTGIPYDPYEDNGPLVDPGGSRYTPDYTNLMCIANPSCRTGFNSEQGAVMRNFALNHPTLAGITAPALQETCDCDYTADLALSINEERFATNSQGQILWSTVVADIGLVSPIEDASLSFDNDVVFDQSVRFVNSTLSFADDVSIVIDLPMGSVRFDNDCTLTACNQQWSGIDLQQGNLRIFDSTVEHAVLALRARSGTLLASYNTVYSNTKAGVQLDEGTLINRFDHNTIINCEATALTSINTSSIRRLGGGNEIAGCRTAIDTEGNHHIANWTISDVITGVIVDDNVLSVIENNDIDGYSRYAIDTRNSQVEIKENLVGISSAGRIGIIMRRGGTSTVEDNTIDANRCGIFLNDLPGSSINGNDVFVTGNSLGGIYAASSPGVTVVDNDVHCPSDGARRALKVTASSNSKIDYNIINTTTTGMEVYGSVGAEIIDNTVTLSATSVSGEIAGLDVLNTGASEILCNNLSGGDRAVWYGQNSQFTTMVQNTMDAEVDLYAQSRMGLQTHHGNRFLGGPDDQGLAIAQMPSPGDVVASRFFVDGSSDATFLPEYTPQQWFSNELGVTINPCSSGNGFNVPNDLVICDLVKRLDTVEQSDVIKYLVDIMDLIRMHQVLDRPVPDCLTKSLDSLGYCDLYKITQMIDTLRRSSVDYDTTLHHVVRHHISQLMAGLGDSSYHELKLYETMAEQDQKREDYSIALDSTAIDVADSLANLSCLDSLTLLWKSVLETYTDYVLEDSVPLVDRSGVETISALCAERYGTVIHWAQSLVTTYDIDLAETYSTRCTATQERSISSTKRQTDLVSIYPNPTTDQISLVSTGEMTFVRIVDARGLVVLEQAIAANQATIDLSGLGSGLYFLQASILGGEDTVHKVIKL